MSKPLCIAISDIHFNIKTNHVAGAALSDALHAAEQLGVPLLINGDLHDTKAMLRAECVTNLIEILSQAKVQVFINIGNHDLLNHHDSIHSLEFLRPYCNLIQSPVYVNELRAWVIPYQHDTAELKNVFKEISDWTAHFKTKPLVFMHQGFQGAAMGEYMVDKTSIHLDDVKNFQVISGHYHKHQTVGSVTYIGSPYTITFAEANDGSKGFLVVNTDGAFEQIPIDLRRHVIIERTTETLYDKVFESTRKADIVWLKVSGPSVELDKLKKKEIGEKLFGRANFKLDKIPTDSKQHGMDISKLTDDQIIDKLISETNESVDQKTFLCKLWRELLNEAR